MPSDASVASDIDAEETVYEDHLNIVRVLQVSSRICCANTFICMISFANGEAWVRADTCLLCTTNVHEYLGCRISHETVLNASWSMKGAKRNGNPSFSAKTDSIVISQSKLQIGYQLHAHQDRR